MADNGNSLSYAFATGPTIAGAQRDHRLRIWCVANKPFGSGIAPRDTESFTHFVDLRCR